MLAPGDGNDRVRFIDVRDLAIWTLRMVEQERLGIFNAVGPEGGLTMRSLLETCREVCNPGAKLCWADAAFLERNEVSAWTDMPVWAPALDPLSSQKAINAGLTFRPLISTIRDTLNWAKSDGKCRPLKSGLDPIRESQLLNAMEGK